MPTVQRYRSASPCHHTDHHHKYRSASPYHHAHHNQIVQVDSHPSASVHYHTRCRDHRSSTPTPRRARSPRSRSPERVERGRAPSPSSPRPALASAEVSVSRDTILQFFGDTGVGSESNSLKRTYVLDSDWVMQRHNWPKEINLIVRQYMLRHHWYTHINSDGASRDHLRALYRKIKVKFRTNDSLAWTNEHDKALWKKVEGKVSTERARMIKEGILAPPPPRATNPASLLQIRRLFPPNRDHATQTNPRRNHPNWSTRTESNTRRSLSPPGGFGEENNHDDPYPTGPNNLGPNDQRRIVHWLDGQGQNGQGQNGWGQNAQVQNGPYSQYSPHSQNGQNSQTGQGQNGQTQTLSGPNITSALQQSFGDPNNPNTGNGSTNNSNIGNNATPNNSNDPADDGTLTPPPTGG